MKARWTKGAERRQKEEEERKTRICRHRICMARSYARISPQGGGEGGLAPLFVTKRGGRELCEVQTGGTFRSGWVVRLLGSLGIRNGWWG
eukprot:759407-Hanusia_phi.AAC.6